jgi:hypothetical protein
MLLAGQESRPARLRTFGEESKLFDAVRNYNFAVIIYAPALIKYRSAL